MRRSFALSHDDPGEARSMAKHSYEIVFKVSGTNEHGAATGRLTLYRGGSSMVHSEAFSGGTASPVHATPIPPESYSIKLAIRGVANSPRELLPVPGTPYFQLHHWYGIERIELPEAQVEWGHYRAALNPPRKNMAPPYRGNFLHGKLRAGDYTHGCICERSESILRWLWLLGPLVVPLMVIK
jgi:hypothetical protein